MLLGNAAAQHPQAGDAAVARALDRRSSTGASVGYLGEAANSVGAQLVRALPGPAGLHAGQMLSQPMKALLLLNVEPALDGADPAAARAALQGSGLVVAMTPFRDAAVDNADVLLPIAPFTETAGTLRQRRRAALQSFPRRRQAARRSAAGLEGAARARQPARPGRASTTTDAEAVRDEALGEPPTRRRGCPTHRPRGAAARPRHRAAWSAWPTCRSTAPTRWCAAPRRCSSRADAQAPVVGLPTVAVAAARPAGAATRCACRKAAPARCCRAREDPSLAATAVRVRGRPSEHGVAGRDVRRASASLAA